ncbi:hypothetical protein BH10CHL1_BH10CHL1_28750 [soil metagenome]
MSVLSDALVSLAPTHDPEMIEGYQRYEALLATMLSTDQIAAYAEAIQQTGEIRIFEELTPAELGALPPAEQAIATAIRANENISMENRRVVALLNQRGQHTVAPDLNGPNSSL